jgi:hypothetical protein
MRRRMGQGLARATPGGKRKLTLKTLTWVAGRILGFGGSRGHYRGDGCWRYNVVEEILKVSVG